MKFSSTLLAGVGIFQQATAQDNHPTTTRALAQSIVQKHHRFLQQGSMDDLVLQVESQLSDDARVCYKETETLETTDPNLIAAYETASNELVQTFDFENSCQISNTATSCTFDFGSASKVVSTGCSAASGKFATMNYGLACTVTSNGEGPLSVAVGVTNYPFCLHASCDSEELTEIMAGAADVSVAQLESGSTAELEGLDVTLDCTYTLDVFVDESKVFASSRSAGDSGSFLRSAQEVGSGSSSTKLTASAFIATAALAIAAIV